MTFTWPWAFTALLAVPLILGAAWWWRRRRRKSVVRVTSLATVRAALPGRKRWIRFLPTALLILGVLTLGIGAARPQATVPVASNSTTIMLALDTSASMCSTDVSPNRITVAEQAAIAFIQAESGAKIGLVAFAGVAGVQVPPTTDTAKLVSAIQQLTVARGTAIGQAILTSIDAISQVDPTVAGTAVDVGTAKAAAYAPDVIVVLTDGANTQGVEPATAAEQAAARGVRVFTIGFGTTTPTRMSCSAAQVEGYYGGGYGGGGYGGGGRGGANPLIIDENALQTVASDTGGQYYRAQDANQLQHALADLPTHVTTVDKKIDIASWFAGIGGLLLVLAVGLSLWFGRVRAPARR